MNHLPATTLRRLAPRILTHRLALLNADVLGLIGVTLGDGAWAALLDGALGVGVILIYLRRPVGVIRDATRFAGAMMRNVGGQLPPRPAPAEVEELVEALVEETKAEVARLLEALADRAMISA